MKTLLICPADREGLSVLTDSAPLVNVPLLGQSLLEYWLAYLASAGTKEVSILASDRAELIAGITGNGARWGISVEVIPELRELTPVQALLRYPHKLDAGPEPKSIIVLDHLPGRAQQPLFSSYADWLEEVTAWMPSACGPDRVGVREVLPGVWVDVQAHVSKRAQLVAPCWVGKKVFVGDDVVLGPRTIVEDRSFIETGVAVSDSLISADTFVGRYAEIKNSIAWGDTLINWKNGSAARVPDPFLLCSLRRPLSAETQSWFARMAELFSRNKADVQLIWKQFLIDKEG
jgi:NDP-sugar pyrophosphorylase family protein